MARTQRRHLELHQLLAAQPDVAAHGRPQVHRQILDAPCSRSEVLGRLLLVGSERLLLHAQRLELTQGLLERRPVLLDIREQSRVGRDGGKKLLGVDDLVGKGRVVSSMPIAAC